MIPTTFGQLGALFDGPHATPTRRDDGPYFLNISSLVEGRLDLSSSDHVSEEDFAKWTRRVTPEPGDLLFSYETRLGEAAMMPEGIRGCLGRRMALLRPRRDVVDPRFLLYFYLSPQFQETIQQRSIHGATVERILLSNMADWPVELPSLPTQRGIAEVLGALDDKIAANTELANAIDGLCEALLHRFRGHGDTTLARIATVNGETVKPGRGDLRYLDISSVSTGGYSWPAPIPWAEAPVRARRLVKAGDTVWSTVRPNRRSHALVLDEGLIGSTGLAVITPTTAGPAFVYEATKTAEFTAYLEAVAEGSAYPAVRAERFLQAPVPNVGTEARERFESVAFPARLRAHAAAVESRRLASLRDSLLPHLMSGRITVREAEKTVEEVL